MLLGVFVDPGDIEDVRRGISQLRRWEAALDGSDARREALRGMLSLGAARLVRLAYEQFRTGRFSLSDLSRRTGEDLRVLQGLAGSLGLVCRRRAVAVFDRHGGEPQLMSVRQEVADLLAAEAQAGV